MDDRGKRALRVLHIGNVANNAYLNAKLLNAGGLDCDVLAYAHYHTMGCPEWEDSDFTGGPVDESRPDWSAVDLQGFSRPPWFAQGPISEAAAYLVARRQQSPSAGLRWRWLNFRRELITARRWAWLREKRQAVRRQEPTGGAPATESDGDSYASFRGWDLAVMRQLFSQYDVVHAYGAEPILPFLCGTHPYVAFEHGTIRVLPFQDSPEGRLTAQAYREADAVLITNADNRLAAGRLGLQRYRFIPHPVNETVPDPAAVARLREDLRTRLNADFLVLHPSRQHWSERRDPHLEKGNDRLIGALQLFFQQRPRAAAVFVNWGATVDATRALLAERGIANRVHWIEPVPGPALARYMAAVEVVADQFYLGAFGAITPRALCLGTPALLHLDGEGHRWAFDQLPPVMNACVPQEIADLLMRGYDDRGWLADLGERGRAWYGRFHSNEVVRQVLLETYVEVLG
jgi:glycosyltransferase involved in cell wall biosynthesis